MKTYLIVEVDSDKPGIRDPKLAGAMLDGAGLRWGVLHNPMFNWRVGKDLHESPEFPTFVDNIDGHVGVGAHVTVRKSSDKL